jgi:hypothetical protein
VGTTGLVKVVGTITMEEVEETGGEGGGKAVVEGAAAAGGLLSLKYELVSRLLLLGDNAE